MIRNLIITATLIANYAYAGTVSAVINKPFEEVYHSVVEAVNRVYLSSMPYRGYGEDFSITLRIDEIIIPGPAKKLKFEADYRDFILPAYIYSLEAEVRRNTGINVKPEGDNTRITVIMYWEMSTPNGWIKVESNNMREENFLNYIVDYHNNPAKYD